MNNYTKESSLLDRRSNEDSLLDRGSNKGSSVSFGICTEVNENKSK